MKDHGPLTRRKLLAIGSTTILGGLAGCSDNDEDITVITPPDEETDTPDTDENMVYTETRNQLEDIRSISGQTTMNATFKSEPRGDFHHLIELTESSTISFAGNEYIARGQIIEDLKIPDGNQKQTEYVEYLIDETRYIGTNPEGGTNWTSQEPPENVFRMSKNLFEILPDKDSFTTTNTSQGKINANLNQQQARAVLETLTAPEIHNNSLIREASTQENLTARFSIVRRNFDIDEIRLVIRSSINSEEVEQNIPENVDAEIEVIFDPDQFNPPFSPTLPEEAKNS